MSIETRAASMRHTATLEVELEFNRDKATTGRNLANAVETLLTWKHLDADGLRRELANLLGDYRAELELNKADRAARGAKIDAAKFHDE